MLRQIYLEGLFCLLKPWDFLRYFLRVQESQIFVIFSRLFLHFRLNFKNYQYDLNAKHTIEKLTKRPFEWVYICWTKSEQNPRYLVPKLTLFCYVLYGSIHIWHPNSTKVTMCYISSSSKRLSDLPVKRYNTA